MQSHLRFNLVPPNANLKVHIARKITCGLYITIIYITNLYINNGYLNVLSLVSLFKIIVEV